MENSDNNVLKFERKIGPFLLQIDYYLKYGLTTLFDMGIIVSASTIQVARSTAHVSPERSFKFFSVFMESNIDHRQRTPMVKSNN